MAKAKELKFYNGRYKGDSLTDKDCERLEKLRELAMNNGGVSELKNVIYELTSSEVEKVKLDECSDYIEKRLGTLEDVQTVGVAFMYYAKKLVLGDSVGMGKTVEMCGLLNFLEQSYEKKGYDFKFLYLTEKTLLEQSRDELIKFTGNYVDMVYGDAKSVKRFVNENSDDLRHSVVGAHSLLNSAGFQEFVLNFKNTYGANPFDALIIDESAIIANTSTIIYKNGKMLAEDIPYVIVMNATPFESNLRAFYSQLSFCDSSLLPPKSTFSRDYEVMKYGIKPYPVFQGKYKNADAFKELVGYRYLARTRKGTGSVMRDCTADIVVTGISRTQRDLLNRTDMKQMVYDCPSYFGADIEMTPESCPKLEALLDLLKGKLKNEDSILVYSRYIESQKGIYEELTKNGISCEVMNGTTDKDERQNLITKFKMGDIRVLVTNVQKGLNFGHCNNCIIYSYDPNPNRMVQFEGRMTRSKDIIGKHLYLIISKGAELKKFKQAVVDKAKASDAFAGSDFSCVMDLLLNSDKLAELE